ncbi:hypothetical protein GXP71_06820 [Cellulomonas sp. H30R-01]|uniref:hypothetical protein n=1 Tax=Cellulomonas sp. H30R-01 TaxID=2704467 RepID=UPI00138CB1CB|nr:hypothetical protein [Cellulomonas sp. H30R-01]QHT55819.1 hypothetical protein GXP71_06820 [Cellulomonas sp. H30R-01]
MTHDDGSTRSVRVRVALPGTGTATTLPSVLVSVEDVSRADAPAVRVGERLLRDVHVPAQGTVLEVDVPATAGPDPRRRFTVRVRAGADPDARAFAPGDLVSTTSVPVLLDGSDDVEVDVRPV